MEMEMRCECGRIEKISDPVLDQLRCVECMEKERRERDDELGLVRIDGDGEDFLAASGIRMRWMLELSEIAEQAAARGDRPMLDAASRLSRVLSEQNDPRFFLDMMGSFDPYLATFAAADGVPDPSFRGMDDFLLEAELASGECFANEAAARCAVSEDERDKAVSFWHKARIYADCRWHPFECFAAVTTLADTVDGRDREVLAGMDWKGGGVLLKVAMAAYEKGRSDGCLYGELEKPSRPPVLGF